MAHAEPQALEYLMAHSEGYARYNVSSIPQHQPGSTTYFHAWDDRPLMTLLPFFAQLRRLLLRVGEAAWEEVSVKKPRLELPSVEVFVLHTQTLDYFRTELQCLIMPNVRSMQIECRPVDTNLDDSETPDEDERFIIHNWILRLLNEENAFQNLESLRLSFWNVGEYCDYYAVKRTSLQHIFSAVFMRFPNLHHLFFEAPFAAVKPKGKKARKTSKRQSNKSQKEPKALADIRAAPLRTLTFQNCPSLRAEDINEVRRELKGRLNWDCFERLRIKWCTSAKKPLIERVASKDKLCFKHSPPDIVEDIRETELPAIAVDPASKGYYDSDNVSSAADLSDFDVSVLLIVHFDKLTDNILWYRMHLMIESVNFMKQIHKCRQD